MSTRHWSALWRDHRPLVGMVHLPALPGAPRWEGDFASVIERATTDARALAGAGFDALMVENFGDVPFYGHQVPSETVAAMTVAVASVLNAVEIPVGVNVLRNDAAAALGIAAATGARFVRVNVHTGAMWTDQGLLEGRAAETLRHRRALALEVAILADVHVKHATPPAGLTLADAAADTWHRGLADALVVTGRGTGDAAAAGDVMRVRTSVPTAPVLVGSGVDAETVQSTLEQADGVIVGSAVMEGGRAGTRVDPRRAAALVRAAGR
jgi:membrane complex biogenesis BtpA family protein